MQYLIFIFEIVIPLAIFFYIFYYLSRAFKKLFYGLSTTPTQEVGSCIPPTSIMPENFKPSQASIDDMIEYWKSFSYQAHKSIPSLEPDLKSIDDVLRQIKVKSDKEAWDISSRPVQMRDIAEIVYINYPRFIMEYSQLPPKMQHSFTMGTGRSAYHLLIENSNFLAARLEELGQELFLSNIKEMLVQERFVKTKYDKSAK